MRRPKTKCAICGKLFEKLGPHMRHHNRLGETANKKPVLSARSTTVVRDIPATATAVAPPPNGTIITPAEHLAFAIRQTREQIEAAEKRLADIGGLQNDLTQLRGRFEALERAQRAFESVQNTLSSTTSA